jgi:DNA-binding transcriptional MerR regulator
MTLKQAMREHTRIKIGDFSQIGHVSVATLHHYDAYGLLKPSALDPHTGYRFYSLDQLPRLNRILALRALGFSLEQIARLLRTDLPRDQLLDMLEQRMASTQSVIETERLRLQLLTTLFHDIEIEDIMPAYDILLKRVEPLLVASIRDRIPHMSERRYLYEQLSSYIAHQGMQISPVDMVLLHSRHEMHDGRMSIDLEVAVPIPETLQGAGQIRVRGLPAELVAYTIHTGNEVTLGRAYMVLHRWIDANGYRIVDTVRQIHLVRPSRGDPGQGITEIQFPVRRQGENDDAAS